MRAVNAMKQNPSSRCQIATQYWKDRYDVLATLEFSRSRKSMSVICAPKVPKSALFSRSERHRTQHSPRQRRARKHSRALFVALHGGSSSLSRPHRQNGTILPLTPELRQHFESVVQSMSAKALRCLAMAGKLELGDLASYNGPSHPAHK